MKKKIMSMMIPAAVATAAASLYIAKNKKNMLDIIIEEVQTKK